MKDTAFFGSDTWEYQSMGVNFAKGHGIQKFGSLESFKTYKFENLTPLPTYYEDFIYSAGQDDFYRSPAYPLFLGLVYRLFGISPRIAKALQLLMLVIIAASLPHIGYHYWRKIGFIGGIPAGFLYLTTNYKLSEEILTESLIAFTVFLVLVALIIYEERQKMVTACLLGFSLGFALLVKGSLIFLPILTFSVILTSTIINKNLGGLKRLLVIMVSTGIMVLPWSTYASVKSGELIFLSTQGNSQLLSDNTELCIDGGYHPGWVDNKAAFYNNDGIKNEHALEKVVNFYLHYPALLPRCLYAKFLRGFGPMPYLWIFAVFLFLDGIFRIINNRVKPEYSSDLKGRFVMRIPWPFWVLGGNFLLITFIFHAESVIVPSRFVAPMDFVFALLCCVIVLTFLSNIYRNLHAKQGGG